jgi:hypothetical protein
MLTTIVGITITNFARSIQMLTDTQVMTAMAVTEALMAVATEAVEAVLPKDPEMANGAMINTFLVLPIPDWNANSSVPLMTLRNSIPVSIFLITMTFPSRLPARMFPNL